MEKKIAQTAKYCTLPVISEGSLPAAAARSASTEASVSRTSEISRASEVSRTSKVSRRSPETVSAVTEAAAAVVHPVHPPGGRRDGHVDIVADHELAVVESLAVIRPLAEETL